MISNTANIFTDTNVTNYNNQYGNFGLINGNGLNNNTHDALTNGPNDLSNLPTINTFQSK
jgi:hypothetical protein